MFSIYSSTDVAVTIQWAFLYAKCAGRLHCRTSAFHTDQPSEAVKSISEFEVSL